MSAAGKQFISLVPPTEKRPRSAFFGPGSTHNFFRDNFTISTWLCIGAAAQGLLFLAVGRMALLPAISLLLYRTSIAYAMSVGWMHNIYMDGVVPKKFSAQYPDAAGEYGTKAADSEIVVFLIGTRNSHPLGAFAPGWKQFGEFFPEMVRQLEESAEAFDFLGMTTWLNGSARQTNSEILTVGYFKSVEGLHKFAHSEYHRQAWDWFNRHTKEYPHMSIYHETYHVPKGNWETIHANSHLSGIQSTVQSYTDVKTGKKMWASPAVDASKGLLRSRAGRMSRSNGDDNEKYGSDPY